MSTLHGQFVWCDLMTTDVAAATAFYRAVIGWDAADAGVPGHAYTILSAAEVPVAGLMALPEAACAAGARPGWTGYIGTDDVDAFAERVGDAGGTILHGPEDIPGVGRFAFAKDPQGAAFYLFKPMEAARPAATLETPGHVGWNELHAGEWQAAFAFYADLFGWTKAEAVDMGAMGVYQLFAAGALPVGGMMTDTSTPTPYWLYYFNVDAVDAAVARAKDAGGQLIQGPHPVPGGSWIAHCRDPQGATFAVVSPTR